VGDDWYGKVHSQRWELEISASEPVLKAFPRFPCVYALS
jgi:hypothetical protein